MGELHALLDLPDPSPDQLRRTAELVERLFDLDTAWAWWERAAQAGDPDSWDYLVEAVREMGGHKYPTCEGEEPDGPRRGAH